MKKIFLSSNQLEKLVFDKILQLNEKQLGINKARKDYKFNVIIPESSLLYSYGNIIILFSAISKIEFPVSESNLLQNQFGLPAGLLTTVNRKTPKEAEIVFAEPETGQNLYFLYNKIRKGFVKLLLFGYRYPVYRKKIESFFSEIQKEDDKITFKLFAKIKGSQSFPFIQISQIAPDEYYRYVWWGKFIVDNIFNEPKDTTGDDLTKTYIDWLKNINVTELHTNTNLLRTVPEPLIPHNSLLLGYLFAAVTPCMDCNKNERILGTMKKLLIKGPEHYNILFWSIVFDGFFNEKENNVYPNPVVQNDFLLMEKFALNFSQKITGKPPITEESPSFKYKHIEKAELISAFYEFTKGKENHSLKILSSEKIFAPFESSLLFGENRKNIGFVNHKIDGSSSLNIFRGLFMFSGNLNLNVSVFYGDIPDETKKRLKQNSKINLPIKPLYKLVDKKKKAFVCFLSDYSEENRLLMLYKEIITDNADQINIKKIIFVKLISTSNEDIHSTTFALENNRLQNKISNDFGIQAKVLIKDTESPDREIIRRLNIELAKYKVKDIEVLDHNFEHRFAKWLLEATNDYVVQYKGHDYYVVS